MSKVNEFDATANLVAWNKRMLSTLGLRPESRSEILFLFYFTYLLYHVIMCYFKLYLQIGSLVRFVQILIEVLSFTHIFLRLCFLRKHNRTIGFLFTQIETDVHEENFLTDSEKQAFLGYNTFAKNFIKILVTFPSVVSVLYYFKPMVLRYFASRNNRLANKNVTIPYMLPFNMYNIIKPTSHRSYSLIYASQLPLTILIGTVQATTDCLVLTLTYHLCGRLSALSHRIRNLNTNNYEEYKKATLVHRHLLRTGKIIEGTLSSLMLVHLLVASTGLCVVLFRTLHYMAPGKRVHLINVFVLLFLTLMRLFSHCSAGEYLLQESDAVLSAFYECNWYNLPVDKQKLIVINLLGSQKPIRLIAGSFGTFSITVFADIIKSAMAYLSFLRKFV